MGRILGKDLVLRTQVGAFHQSGGVVKVALVGDLTQFDKDLPTQSKTLRFRLNPEHCIEWTLRPGIQQELARMHFMERMLLEPLTPLIVTIGNRISTASLVGTIGVELDAGVFRQLEVGSFYDCRVRVTRWELL